MLKKIIMSAAVSAVCFTGALAAQVDNNTLSKYIEFKYGMTMDTVSPAQIEQVKKEIETREELYTVAKQKNLISENDERVKFLQDVTNKDVYINVFLDKYHKSIKVTDLELQEAYSVKKTAGMFVKPETFKARHILVNSEEQAQKIIDDLKVKDGDKVKNFIDMAKMKSTGPSGKNGGDLGWFDAKSMVPEFSAAVANLEKGGLTEFPVKTQFGYHVILLEDKKEAGESSFEEVKDSLVKGLQDQKMQEFMNQHVKR